MKISKRVNKIRALILHALTRRVGRENKQKMDFYCLQNDLLTIKRILVSRPNSRLGNQLLITPLIQELEYLFPHCKIDLFVRGGIAPILFKNYESVDRVIFLPKKPFKDILEYIKVWINVRKYKYDLVINTVEGSSSGRLSTKISNSRLKFFNNVVPELKELYSDYEHMAKFTVYNLRNSLIRQDSEMNKRSIAPLNIRLAEEEKVNGRCVISQILNNRKRIIGIYTFATADKCYSREWWENLYELLKEEFYDEYDILEILPIENCSQIDFKAPSYYSKDLREIASVIDNLDVFISADCGIMHLGSATDVPVVGLFSVTNLDMYQPYGRLNVAIDTNNTSHKDIVHTVKSVLNKKYPLENFLISH